jgi:hypothetical protein
MKTQFEAWSAPWSNMKGEVSEALAVLPLAFFYFAVSVVLIFFGPFELTFTRYS